MLCRPLPMLSIALLLVSLAAPLRAAIEEIETEPLRSFAEGNPVDVAWFHMFEPGKPWTIYRLYVLDAAGGSVTQYDESGQVVRRFGSFGSGPGQLAFPQAMAATAEAIYVADTGNDRIQVFDFDGNPVRTIGGGGSAPGQFRDPRGVCVNTRNLDGVLIVADTGNDRIQILDLEGGFEREIPIPRPIAVTYTTYEGVVVASAVLGSLRAQTGGVRFQLEPVPAMAAVLQEAPIEQPGHIIETDDKIYLSDRESPRIVVLSETWDTIGRIDTSLGQVRAVAMGGRKERPSILVADGSQVVELGFHVDSPLPTFEKLRAALAQKDVDAALEYIHPARRYIYREIYERIRDALPQEAKGMENVELYSLSENQATLYITKEQLIDGRPQMISYEVLMSRMPDGSWKVVDY